MRRDVPGLDVNAYRAIALSIFSILILSTSVFFSPRHAVYDEGYYLAAVDLFKLNGFSMSFVREQPGPAGLTFSLIHGLLEPITLLQFPAVRWVNVVLLVLSATMVSVTYHALNPQLPRLSAWAWGLSLMAMPFMGVSTGMALTEIPGLAFLCAAVLCLMSGAKDDDSHHYCSAIVGVIGGIFFALAIMARQNCLLILLASPVLMFGAHMVEQRKIAVTFAVSALLVLPVFITWGGLVPPRTAWVGSGISVYHITLSLAYLCVVSLIIDPSVTYEKRGTTDLVIIGALALGLSGLILVGGEFQPFLPMSTLLRNVLPTGGATFLAAVTPGVICVAAASFSYQLSRAIFKSLLSGDRRRAYLWSAALLLCLSNGKVTHQFSSRYVVGAVPLMLLASMSPAYFQPAYLIRLLAGTLLSLIALQSYFTNAGGGAPG